MKLKFRQKLSSKELRQQTVEQLKKELTEAKSLILFSSQLIKHQAFEDFRKKLDAAQAKLHFVKNTLFKVAARELKLPEALYADLVLTGPTAAIYILGDDYIAVIKAFAAAFGDQEGVQVKIAFLDKEIYGKDQVLQFSRIPSVAELQAKLVSLINNPIQKFYYSLTYDLGKLVRSLGQIAQKGVN